MPKKTTPVKGKVIAKKASAAKKKVASSVAKPAGKTGKAAKVLDAKKVSVKPAEKAEKVKSYPAKAVKNPVAAAESKVETNTKPKKELKVKKTKAEVASEKQLSEDVQKWSDYHAKLGGEKAPNYSMSGVFEAKTAIQHKVLGWGYILSVQNDRLEVLFETGPKILISNYKLA